MIIKTLAVTFFALCFSLSLAQTTLTMWARTPETIPLLRESIARFQEEHPDVRINLVDFGADAYPGALQAAISGQDLPDIFHVHNSVPLSRLVNLGLVQPLEPFFSQDFIADFDPATWWEGSTTVDGEIYAWPDRSFRRASLYLYSNREVMEQAGLNPDTPPSTWEALLEQANQVSEWGAGRAYGLHIGFTSGWFIERIVLQLASTVSADRGVPNEHLPGRMINWQSGEMFDYDEVPAVLELFAEMMATDAIHPNFIGTGRSQATAQWAVGQAAFLIDGSWRLQEILRDDPDFDFNISYLPSQTGTPPLWGVEGGSQNAFVISSQSDNAELAARFFEFLSEDYYPLLLENSVDLTPIPALNARAEELAAPQFADFVRLSEDATLVLPSPVMRNPEQLEVVTRLAGKQSRQPFGETMEGFIAAANTDALDYLQSYAAEQQRFLEEAIAEAQAAGADVSADEWLFEDWNPLENYY